MPAVPPRRRCLTWWRWPESQTGPQLKGPAAARQMAPRTEVLVILQPWSSPTTATVTATFHGI